MNEPKYKIGQNISNTLAFGDVKVTDIFKSITNTIHVYEVSGELGLDLAGEEELQQENVECINDTTQPET